MGILPLTARSPVARLLRACRPAAITRCVIPIIVDAIKAVVRSGLAAHIGEKIRVGLKPSLAYGDASPPVVTPPNIGAVVAPSPQPNPRAMFRRSTIPMRVANHGDRISNKAAATSGWASFEAERVTCPDNNGAALAATYPLNEASSPFRVNLDDGESPDDHASHVYRLRVVGKLHWLRHDASIPEVAMM